MRTVAIGLVLAVLALELPQLLTETTAVTSYAANMLFTHNFHEVVEDRFYRSAYMPPKELNEVIRRKKIRTVINLTRSGAKVEERKREQAAVLSAGAEYIEIPLNSGRLPSGARLTPLLETYESVTPPVLVHCRSGTHRSGVAAAIWLLEQENASFAEAAKQLSPRYGFFRFERKLKSLTGGHPTIDELLWDYERSLGRHREPLAFRDWVINELSPYDSEDELLNACPAPVRPGKL